MEVQQDRSFALRAPAWVDTVVLTSNAAQDYTIPAGVDYVCFASTANFYVAYRGGGAASVYSTTATAVVPVASTSNGTSNELNPTVRYVGGLLADKSTREISVLSLISASSCIITLQLYR